MYSPSLPYSGLLIAIIASRLSLKFCFLRNNNYLDNRVIFPRKTIIVCSNFFAKNEAVIIIINPSHLPKRNIINISSTVLNEVLKRLSVSVSSSLKVIHSGDTFFFSGLWPDSLKNRIFGNVESLQSHCIHTQFHCRVVHPFASCHEGPRFKTQGALM